MATFDDLGPAAVGMMKHARGDSSHLGAKQGHLGEETPHFK